MWHCSVAFHEPSGVVPVARWSLRMHKDAKDLIENILKTAGDRDRQFIDVGETAVHWRRAMTDADAAALAKRPIWET